MRTVQWIYDYMDYARASAPEQEMAWGAGLPQDLLDRSLDHLESLEGAMARPWLCAWYECIGWRERAEKQWSVAALSVLYRLGFPTSDLVKSAEWLCVGVRAAPPASPLDAARWIIEVSKQLRRGTLYIRGPASDLTRWWGLKPTEYSRVSRRQHPQWGTLYVWLKGAVQAQTLHPRQDPRPYIEDIWQWRMSSEEESRLRWELWTELRSRTREGPLHTEPPDSIDEVLSRGWGHANCPICRTTVPRRTVAAHCWTKHLTSPLRQCLTCWELLPSDHLNAHPCLAELACPLDGTDLATTVRWNPRGYKHIGHLVTLHDILW